MVVNGGTRWNIPDTKAQRPQGRIELLPPRRCEGLQLGDRPEGAAKDGRVMNWRWIDAFDESDEDYERFEYMHAVEVREAEWPEWPGS